MITFTVDAKHVMKKWSTWLALISASCAGGLLAYSQVPPDLQSTVPHWLVSACSTISVVAGILIPIATSIQQANIPAAVIAAAQQQEQP